MFTGYHPQRLSRGKQVCAIACKNMAEYPPLIILTMKRLFLGLSAIAIAVSGSAFVNAPKDPAKNFAAITYYQSTSTGTYVKVEPSGDCTNDDKSCKLIFPNPNQVPESSAPDSFVLGSTDPTNLGTPAPAGGLGFYH